MAGNKNWSIEDIDYLKANWHNKSIEALMLKLNRTKDSVFRKAIRIGLNTRKKEEDLLKKRWDTKSDNYIINNYKKKTSTQIAKILNRSATAVRKRAAYLEITGIVRKWTTEEEEYLYENWGLKTVDSIAKKLNRSRDSILLKAYNLGLREQIIANGAYLTPPDIEEILGIPIRTIYNWIWIGKLTCKKFNVGKRKKYQINPSEFCKFLELNQGSWNTQNADMTLLKGYFSTYFLTKDDNIKIKEDLPEWFMLKIENDKKILKNEGKAWTKQEEEKLMKLASMGYNNKMLSKELQRTVNSVKTRKQNLRRIAKGKY